MKIDLLENGIHSLAKGLEDYQSFQKKRGRFIIKDSILRIHHGIELCLKFILFKLNRVWILNGDIKLKKIVEAEAKAKREKISFLEATDSCGIRNLTLIDSFNRIEMICPDLLPAKSMNFLSEKITEFVRFRNLLQHHEANFTTDEVCLHIGSVLPLLFLILKHQIPQFRNQLNRQYKDATKIIDQLERKYGVLSKQRLNWLKTQPSLKIRLELEFEHEIRSRRLKSYTLKLGGAFTGVSDAMIVSGRGDSGLPQSLVSIDDHRLNDSDQDINLSFKFDEVRLYLDKAPVFSQKVKVQNLNILLLLKGTKWEQVCEEHEDYIDDYTEIWSLENDEAEILIYSKQPKLKGEGQIILPGTKKNIKPQAVVFESILNFGEVLITRVSVMGEGYSYHIKISALCDFKIKSGNKSKMEKV